MAKSGMDRRSVYAIIDLSFRSLSTATDLTAHTGRRESPGLTGNSGRDGSGQSLTGANNGDRRTKVVLHWNHRHPPDIA